MGDIEKRLAALEAKLGATEAAKQREAAEIVAVIEFYERTGRSPEGYNVIDPECRKTF